MEQTEPDVYQYDWIAPMLRAQIQHIWETAIGPYYEPRISYSHTGSPPNNNEAWNFIRGILCRELGRLSLASEDNPKRDCISYLQDEKNIDNWLDLVEFSFRYIRTLVGKGRLERDKLGIRQAPDDAIEELNFRFREARIGYQFEEGQIIRVDAELIHAEVVRPALHLLSDPRFAGPEEEFLAAHAHYRAGEYKDCVANALKAFESTMKAICDIKGWEYGRGARASDLIKVLRAKGLLPNYLDNSFNQLIATLSSGLPKVRNEEGGHGVGAQPRETPSYVAAYALHLAAAKIVFLVEAMKASA